MIGRQAPDNALPVITASLIRELTLRTPASAGRRPHLSAASGLVAAGEWLYVVADDEFHIGVFPAIGDAPGDRVVIFPGELPDAPNERKARKPDLEALTCLPPFAGYPHGALLALASGAKPDRRTGALLSLDARGEIAGAPRLIDLSGVYGALAAQFPALNIEGAVVIGDQLRLMHRGNAVDAVNAIIRLSLPDVLHVLSATDSIGTAEPLAIQSIDLGTVDGIPLGFTDGAALPDGTLVFTAVAENAKNSYDDGPCAGAVIGIADDDGRLRYLERLAPGYKVEGIAATVEGGVIRLLLVTDADDADIPGCLLAAEIRGYSR